MIVIQKCKIRRTARRDCQSVHLPTAVETLISDCVNIYRYILNIKKIRSQWAVNMGSQPPEVMPLWRFSQRTYGDAVFGALQTEYPSTRMARLYGGKQQFTGRI